jgi:hypothetical protein
MRSKLYLAQHGKCAGCLQWLPVTSMETDHKVPISKGGHDGPPNIWLLCRLCNRRKRDTIVTGIEFGLFDGQPGRKRKQQNFSVAVRRQEARANGLCIDCCNRKARKGKTRCLKCLKAQRLAAAKYRRGSIVITTPSCYDTVVNQADKATSIDQRTRPAENGSLAQLRQDAQEAVVSAAASPDRKE